METCGRLAVMGSVQHPVWFQLKESSTAALPLQFKFNSLMSSRSSYLHGRVVAARSSSSVSVAAPEVSGQYCSLSTSCLEIMWVEFFFWVFMFYCLFLFIYPLVWGLTVVVE